VGRSCAPREPLRRGCSATGAERGGGHRVPKALCSAQQVEQVELSKLVEKGFFCVASPPKARPESGVHCR
jgi:hypothetical protein